MKTLYFMICILLFFSCKKIELKDVPDGYESLETKIIDPSTKSCADTIYKNVLDTIRTDLINSQGNFDILFPSVYKICPIDRPDFPAINFSTKTLIIGKIPVHGQDGDRFIDSRVFINKAEKKIIIRALIQLGTGGYQWNYYPSYIIDKVTNDFTIENQTIEKSGYFP